jgi:chaperonin GroES
VNPDLPVTEKTMTEENTNAAASAPIVLSQAPPVLPSDAKPVVDKPSTILAPTVKPLHEKVVVERMDAETKSAGGILIPDTAKEKPMRGTVIAVGPGRVLDSGEVKALEVKKGDKVLFGGYAGSEVKLDGKDYLIVNESEIFAVIG